MSKRTTKRIFNHFFMTRPSEYQSHPQREAGVLDRDSIQDFPTSCIPVFEPQGEAFTAYGAAFLSSFGDGKRGQQDIDRVCGLNLGGR